MKEKLFKKRQGEGNLQMQQEKKKKKKKRNNGQDNMARSEGEENEGHQANWRWVGRILCPDGARREMSKERKNVAFGGLGWKVQGQTLGRSVARKERATD